MPVVPRLIPIVNINYNDGNHRVVEVLSVVGHAETLLIPEISIVLTGGPSKHPQHAWPGTHYREVSELTFKRKIRLPIPSPSRDDEEEERQVVYFTANYVN